MEWVGSWWKEESTQAAKQDLHDWAATLPSTVGERQRFAWMGRIYRRITDVPLESEDSTGRRAKVVDLVRGFMEQHPKLLQDSEAMTDYLKVMAAIRGFCDGAFPSSDDASSADVRLRVDHATASTLQQVRRCCPQDIQQQIINAFHGPDKVRFEDELRHGYTLDLDEHSDWDTVAAALEADPEINTITYSGRDIVLPRQAMEQLLETRPEPLDALFDQVKVIAGASDTSEGLSVSKGILLALNGRSLDPDALMESTLLVLPDYNYRGVDGGEPLIRKDTLETLIAFAETGDESLITSSNLLEIYDATAFFLVPGLRELCEAHMRAMLDDIPLDTEAGALFLDDIAARFMHRLERFGDSSPIELLDNLAIRNLSGRPQNADIVRVCMNHHLRLAEGADTGADADVHCILRTLDLFHFIPEYVNERNAPVLCELACRPKVSIVAKLVASRLAQRYPHIVPLHWAGVLRGIEDDKHLRDHLMMFHRFSPDLDPAMPEEYRRREMLNAIEGFIKRHPNVYDDGKAVRALLYVIARIQKSLETHPVHFAQLIGRAGDMCRELRMQARKQLLVTLEEGATWNDINKILESDNEAGPFAFEGKDQVIPRRLMMQLAAAQPDIPLSELFNPVVVATSPDQRAATLTLSKGTLLAMHQTLLEIGAVPEESWTIPAPYGVTEREGLPRVTKKILETFIQFLETGDQRLITDDNVMDLYEATTLFECPELNEICEHRLRRFIGRLNPNNPRHVQLFRKIAARFPDRFASTIGLVNSNNASNVMRLAIAAKDAHLVLVCAQRYLPNTTGTTHSIPDQLLLCADYFAKSPGLITQRNVDLVYTIADRVGNAYLQEYCPKIKPSILTAKILKYVGKDSRHTEAYVNRVTNFIEQYRSIINDPKAIADLLTALDRLRKQVENGPAVHSATSASGTGRAPSRSTRRVMLRARSHARGLPPGSRFIRSIPDPKGVYTFIGHEYEVDDEVPPQQEELSSRSASHQSERGGVNGRIESMEQHLLGIARRHLPEDQKELLLAALGSDSERTRIAEILNPQRIGSDTGRDDVEQRPRDYPNAETFTSTAAQEIPHRDAEIDDLVRSIEDADINRTKDFDKIVTALNRFPRSERIRKAAHTAFTKYITWVLQQETVPRSALDRIKKMNTIGVTELTLTGITPQRPARWKLLSYLTSLRDLKLEDCDLGHNALKLIIDPHPNMRLPGLKLRHLEVVNCRNQKNLKIPNNKKTLETFTRFLETKDQRLITDDNVIDLYEATTLFESPELKEICEHRLRRFIGRLDVNKPRDVQLFRKIAARFPDRFAGTKGWVNYDNVFEVMRLAIAANDGDLVLECVQPYLPNPERAIFSRPELLQLCVDCFVKNPELITRRNVDLVYTFASGFQNTDLMEHCSQMKPSISTAEMLKSVGKDSKPIASHVRRLTYFIEEHPSIINDSKAIEDLLTMLDRLRRQVENRPDTHQSGRGGANSQKELTGRIESMEKHLVDLSSRQS